MKTRQAPMTCKKWFWLLAGSFIRNWGIMHALNLIVQITLDDVCDLKGYHL